MRALLTNIVITKSGTDKGAPVSGATVTLYEADGTTPLANTLYATATSQTPITSPLTTDGNGRFSAYINGGGKPCITVASGAGVSGTVTTADYFFPDSSRMPIDVRSYGAKCDGVTDDTAAIQAAFNAGGTVLMPMETGDVGYKITSTLYIGDGTAIKISGVPQSLRVIGTSAIVAPPSAASEATTDGYANILWYGAAGGVMIEVRGSIQNLHIEGLGLDCRGIASCGFRTTNMQKSVMMNCKVISYTNCTNASAPYRTDTAAYDIRAWSTGEAVPSSALASVNGGNSCLFLNLSCVSASPRAVGFAVGSQIVLDTDGTRPIGSADVSQCTFVNCISRSELNDGKSIGLALRYTDAVTFTNCTMVGIIPISVEVSPNATDDNGLHAFPNFIVMNNPFIDSFGHAWDNCRVIGTWIAEQKLVFSPLAESVDNPLASGIETFGWGWTTHDRNTLKSGLIGDWHVTGDMLFDGDVSAGGNVALNGQLISAGRVTSTAGDLYATVGNVVAGGLVYGSGQTTYGQNVPRVGITLADTQSTIIGPSSIGLFMVYESNAGSMALVLLQGVGHTVVLVVQTSTTFEINSGTDTNKINIYHDGTNYVVKNQNAASNAITVFRVLGS